MKKELAASLFQQFFIPFDTQLKLLRQQVIEKFDREIRKIVADKDQVNEQYYKETQSMFQDSLAYFKRKSCGLIIENSGWGEQYIIHEKELEMMMKSVIKNGKEKEIDKLLELTLVSEWG